jgi:hypothetical protein
MGKAAPTVVDCGVVPVAGAMAAGAVVRLVRLNDAGVDSPEVEA